MVTCKQMKELEQKADAAGLSYYQMMENAGTCATVIIMGSVPSLLNGGNAVILCGKGNNGGDGLVVARLLAGYGTKVTIVLVEGKPVTEDAIKNFQLLDSVENVTVTGKTPSLEALEKADVIVDALYGTGFHGPMRQNANMLVSDVNLAQLHGTFVAALDIPSGLPGDIDDHQPIGPCVHADATITFHDKKQIHRNLAAQRVLGKVTVADIGIGKALKL